MGLGEIRGIGDTELSKAKQYNEWWVQFNYLEVRWTKNNEGFGFSTSATLSRTHLFCCCLLGNRKLVSPILARCGGGDPGKFTE